MEVQAEQVITILQEWAREDATLAAHLRAAIHAAGYNTLAQQNAVLAEKIQQLQAGIAQEVSLPKQSDTDGLE